MAFLRYNQSIALNPVERDDLEYFKNALNKPQVRRYMLLDDSPLTMNDEKDWYENNVLNGERIVLKIEYQREAAGVITLIFQGPNRVAQTAELGIWIDEPYWGNNLGYITSSLMITYGFDSVGLHRIDAQAFAPNESNNVLTKLGFTKEGTRREARYYDGDYMDVNQYGLLKSEWKRSEHPEPWQLP